MAYSTLRLRPLTTGASKGLDVQSGNLVLGWIQWGPSQQLGFANVYDCTYEGQGSTLGVIPQGPLPLRQSFTNLGLANYTTLTSEPKDTLLSSPPGTGIRKI